MNPAVHYGRMDAANGPETKALFRSVFSDSEGEEQGVLLETIAGALCDELGGTAVFGYAARRANTLIGAIFFSRMQFESDLDAFLLSPVAVHTGQQGRGTGQALILYGLDELRAMGVQFVATYGDPAFYSRVGFKHISPHIIQPPFPLSQPEGWLGQSLEGRGLDTYSGRFTCVRAFNDASLW